jgi:hypothetical protein
MKFLKNSSIDIADIIFYTLLVVFGTIPVVLFVIFVGLGVVFTAITEPMTIVLAAIPYLVIGLIMWLIFKPSKSEHQSPRLIPRPSSVSSQQPSISKQQPLSPITNQFVARDVMDATKFPKFFADGGSIFKVSIENEMLRAFNFDKKSSTFVPVPGVLEIMREGFEVSLDELPYEVKLSLKNRPKNYWEEKSKQFLEGANEVLIREGKIKPQNNPNQKRQNPNHQLTKEQRQERLRKAFIAALREMKEQEAKNTSPTSDSKKYSREQHRKNIKEAIRKIQEMIKNQDPELEKIV